MPLQVRIDLALYQIEQLVKKGCIPDYIVADAFYGNNIDFREYCRDLKIKYVLDIKENLDVFFRVY
jgi:SRSO17 transposase